MSRSYRRKPRYRDRLWMDILDAHRRRRDDLRSGVGRVRIYSDKRRKRGSVWRHKQARKAIAALLLRPTSSPPGVIQPYSPSWESLWQP